MPAKRPYSSSTGDDDSSPDGPIYRVAPGGSSGGRLVPGGTELVPVPDPTKLTTDQLRREIMALREILEQRIEGNDKFIDVLKEQGDQRQISLTRRQSTCGNCWSSNSVHCGPTWLANWKS